MLPLFATNALVKLQLAAQWNHSGQISRVSQKSDIQDALAADMTIADLTVFLSQLQAAYCDGFDGIAFLVEKIRETEERIAASERFLEVLRLTREALEIAPFEID